jgi:hypothetical protein
MIYCHIHTARGVAHARATCSRCRQIIHEVVVATPHRDAPPKGLRSGEFRRGTKTEN